MIPSKEACECIFPVAPKFIDKSGNVKLLEISMITHDIALSVSKKTPLEEGWSLKITTRTEPCMESIVYNTNSSREKSYHELNRMAKITVLAVLYPPDEEGQRLDVLNKKQTDIAISVILKAFGVFGIISDNSDCLPINTVPWYGISHMYDVSEK